MILLDIVLALHLLAAVLWVGGLAFAAVVLWPGVSVLEPGPRLALHAKVFRRFFLLVWHAMPIILLSGYAMLFGWLGGFAGVNGAVHVMHLLGLLMSGIFLWVFFGPWRAMRAATSDAARTAAVNRVTSLLRVSLGIGLFTVILGAFA
jgi:uncharacterized membrane protein